MISAIGTPVLRGAQTTAPIKLLSALPVSILGLQDTHKFGHAGPIPMVVHHRNLSIGRGPVSLPDPPQKIGDLLHGVYSVQPYSPLYTNVGLLKSFLN
jgi:hypothetical protein